MGCGGTKCVEVEDDDNNYFKNIVLEQINNDPNYDLVGVFVCRFCGGKDCKHENPGLRTDNAITGLNSDQIDNNIFASQRPSNSLIKKYNLVEKFKEKEIGLIINLQIPGEHPHCGPIEHLEESGFSYSPSLFECEDINVSICGWKDMTTPDSKIHMLWIVKQMQYYINIKKKKVLVHCHAGYGRTGIVIACYKIYDELLLAKEAIEIVRQKRKGSIQTEKQKEYCIKFQDYLQRLRANFLNNEARQIETLLYNQKLLDVGNYKFRNLEYNKFIPLFLQYIFDSIIELKKKKKVKNENEEMKKLLPNLDNQELDKNVSKIVAKINKYKWESLYQCEDLSVLYKTLFFWFRKSIIHVIDPENITRIDNSYEDYNKKLKTCEQQTLLFIFKSFSLLQVSVKQEENKQLFSFCCLLLGYSIEEAKIDENMQKVIQKLIGLMGNLFQKKEIN